MYLNNYLMNIKQYISDNTPIQFLYLDKKYNEIETELNKQKLTHTKKQLDIICASYTLFYTSLEYHKLANQPSIHQPYYILVGDYIMGYVVELLYKNKMYALLKVFSYETKCLLLNILNNMEEDNLLENIVNTLKE